MPRLPERFLPCELHHAAPRVKLLLSEYSIALYERLGTSSNHQLQKLSNDDLSTPFIPGQHISFRDRRIGAPKFSHGVILEALGHRMYRLRDDDGEEHIRNKGQLHPGPPPRRRRQAKSSPSSTNTALLLWDDEHSEQVTQQSSSSPREEPRVSDTSEPAPLIPTEDDISDLRPPSFTQPDCSQNSKHESRFPMATENQSPLAAPRPLRPARDVQAPAWIRSGEYEIYLPRS
ncbi:hypothetical protein PPYR_07214 [Photinus pyralis]|uniref:Uncharacterized protein n=1 Tax=Photinus pyralis TaxID=7054 RepID=A0A5N4APT8_PHOPY|nr:hypothetical protein PPYR_07214 [Photinus pyralis]